MDCSLMTRPSCSMKGVGSFEGQDGLLLALVEGLLPMVVNIPFNNNNKKILYFEE
jgi:hypothetical protein